MRAFTHHFFFEFKTGIRNKQLLLLNYLFPLGFFFLMGLIMTEINPNFQDDLIPAMVVFAVLAATMLGMPDPLVNAREKGIYRSYRINGVPAISILLIPALTTAMHTTIVASVITSVSYLFFDAPLPADWMGYLLTFISLVIACSGLSLLIGVVSPNSRMTVLWSQVIFTPSMMLGGMMLPYSLLPDAAGKVAQLLPATHAMNAFRALAMNEKADLVPWLSIGTLILSGLLAFVLALILFSWDSKNATRRLHPLMGLLVLFPTVLGIATSVYDVDLKMVPKAETALVETGALDGISDAQAIHPETDLNIPAGLTCTDLEVTEANSTLPVKQRH